MKYKHTDEVVTVLDDLENRIRQLIEVNDQHKDKYPNIVGVQNVGFQSVLVLIGQVRDNGHVMRGSSAVPDSIEPLAKTKWDKRPQLGV